MVGELVRDWQADLRERLLQIRARKQRKVKPMAEAKQDELVVEQVEVVPVARELRVVKLGWGLQDRNSGEILTTGDKKSVVAEARKMARTPGVRVFVEAL